MSKRVNIGVLGCASIAKRFVIPALQKLGEFHLVGIASRTKNKADEFAKEFKTTPFYGYESLLEIKGLDAVYIPLPNSMHFKWIKKALNKNLNILVEKSMACRHEEVAELNNLAKEKNLALVENFQFRFHSQLKYIKELVNSGKIGELRNIRASFGFPPFSDSDNIRYKKELGGGALLDAGAYVVKISQLFMGNYLNVSASHLVFDDNLDIDIWGNASLQQINGDITSQVSFGFDNYYQCSLELWGSKGKIFSNRIFTSPPDHKPLIELENSDGKNIIELKKDNHFVNMLLYFYDLINGVQDKSKEYNDSLNQSRLIESLRNKSI